MSNSQMSALHSRIASFNSWITSEKNHHGDVDNCQNRIHVEFSNSTSFLKLARAGFYYSEHKGVECFLCGVKYQSWGKESPVAVHRILNPNCPHLDPTNPASDGIIDTLFSTPEIHSLADSRSSNNSCSRSQQPFDDHVTPERGLELQNDRNLNQYGGSLLDRNSQGDETPQNQNTEFIIDRAEVINVRRNLFLEADDAAGHNTTPSFLTNNSSSQVTPERYPVLQVDESIEILNLISLLEKYTTLPLPLHALVSPTCQFILHEKGQEFITRMAKIKKLAQLDPLVTEPVCQIGDLVVPDPYPPTLTRDLLTAFTSCGKYPNISMLKAAVLADGELKKKVDDLDLHKEVIEKKDKQLEQIENIMTAKDKLTKSTVDTINQLHCLQLNDKDMEIVEKEQQCEQIVQQKDQIVQQKDLIVQQKDLIVQQKDQQIHQHKQQLCKKDHQLHQHKQQLHQQGQQLCQQNRQNLVLHCTRQQLRNQLEERDSIIDQQFGQLEDLNSRLLTAVSRHEEREVTLVEQRNGYMTLTQEIEREKQEIEDEIKRYERELSILSNECSRLKRQGDGDGPGIGGDRPGIDGDRPGISPDRPGMGGDRPGDSNRICLFCLNEDRTVMFEPCRHICCCNNCLPNFKYQPCPICRTPIQGWQVVFLN